MSDFRRDSDDRLFLLATVYLEAVAFLPSLVFRGAHTTVLQPFDAYNVTRPSESGNCVGVLSQRHRWRKPEKAYRAIRVRQRIVGHHARFSCIAFPSCICRFLLLSGSVATRPMFVVTLLRVRLKCSAVGVGATRILDAPSAHSFQRTGCNDAALGKSARTTRGASPAGCNCEQVGTGVCPTRRPRSRVFRTNFTNGPTEKLEFTIGPPGVASLWEPANNDRCWGALRRKGRSKALIYVCLTLFLAPRPTPAQCAFPAGPRISALNNERLLSTDLFK